MYDESAVQKDEVTCPVCLNIVKDPLYCSKCEKFMCNPCIEDWVKRGKNNCPHCRQVGSYNKIPRPSIKMIANIKFNCKNIKKGCNEIVTYENYHRHHKDTCKFIHSFECHECGDITHTPEQFKSHLEEKHKKTELVECMFCNTMVELEQLVDHENLCENMKKCKHCDKRISSHLLDKHQDECILVPVECKFCRTKFLKTQLDTHTKDECYKITMRFNKHK